ncbi:ATP-dependent Clp protease ATP-binding subunit [Alicyclobacillus sp. SO9]|uniref:ATP-dependent Clp protease ATP-binding subunit n=1 Tax=Alicyclobacillus sp. SO9 TaxID=2665646 RepID=UPI0018E7983B|nr:ATP-dependent Clp protease ATP-binding subunit [Alicyclobacillus sp. SO9]QQE80146.1 AAA family ATPase [Alicyclobacillus sp. SO9]
MLCQECKTNQATIELHVQFNHEKEKLHLCTSCYEKITSGAKSPAASFSFGSSPLDDLLGGFFASGQPGMSGTSQGMPQQGPPAGNGGGGVLDEFGRDLSSLVRNGKIDPVIGRDKEVARVIEILNRRNKNNPVLIGEPGVGKTAIAEGLALKIAEGDVPSKLKGKQIYALDVSSLVADTGIRGQFEQRMRQLISELEQRPNVILFIDEVHLLVGAGSAQGSMDAGNILKPALARGEIQVVGATTLKEYKAIEKDAALERRFQPIMVSEPTIAEATAILEGLQQQYEKYHHVRYTDDALRACVTLSNRYIQDRFLPDKAIDLMDEAGSKANLTLAGDNGEDLTLQLEQTVKRKQEATKNEQYELAAKLRDEEEKLRRKLNEAAPQTQTAEVTLAQIQQIVEEKTGIPVQKLQQSEQNRLKDLDSRLGEKVIGQRDAVKKVAKAIRRSRAGLKAANRPIGSFLFVGPTGVGKTELARQLAEELFGTKDAMIRLDMSEYMEKHSVSKLIGSPPGYVGYDEAGQLTERVRRKPYSLVLLDEIEKAHPDVQHMFLQIMEDGRLTDSQGRVVSFKDTLIIMTSNAGVVDRKAAVGFGVDEEQSKSQNHLSALGMFFKPEFLNRFDAVIEFESLHEEELRKIVDLLLADVRTNLSEQGIALSWSDEVARHIGLKGYHPAYGARPLRRMIQEIVEDPIADLLLDEEKVNEIILQVVDNQVTLESK